MCISEMNTPQVTPPEVSLAKHFKDDLGIVIDPQALRMFIRMRWDSVSVLAHLIHDPSLKNRSGGAIGGQQRNLQP